MTYPNKVEICEVGPRDGFQFEATSIPTELKLEVIEGLVAAGIQSIQAVSFVHPSRVPQMADAEEVVSSLPDDKNVIFSGLALNARGLERAADSGLSYVDLSIATHEKHGRDNANMSVEGGVELAGEMIQRARERGLEVQIGLQTVFGYEEPGDTDLDEIVDMVGRFARLSVESISLADSTGMANPRMIRERLAAVQRVSEGIPIVLHLHDTRGLGLANLVAALEMDITRFDTSFGGLGGCPFIPGATGNIATEDVVYLLEEMGISTGIDIPAVAACSRRISAFLGRPLSGRMYNLV